MKYVGLILGFGDCPRDIAYFQQRHWESVTTLTKNDVNLDKRISKYSMSMIIFSDADADEDNNRVLDIEWYQVNSFAGRR